MARSHASRFKCACILLLLVSFPLIECGKDKRKPPKDRSSDQPAPPAKQPRTEGAAAAGAGAGAGAAAGGEPGGNGGPVGAVAHQTVPPSIAERFTDMLESVMQTVSHLDGRLAGLERGGSVPQSGLITPPPQPPSSTPTFPQLHQPDLGSAFNIHGVRTALQATLFVEPIPLLICR